MRASAKAGGDIANLLNGLAVDIAPTLEVCVQTGVANLDALMVVEPLCGALFYGHFCSEAWHGHGHGIILPSWRKPMYQRLHQSWSLGLRLHGDQSRGNSSSCSCAEFSSGLIDRDIELAHLLMSRGAVQTVGMNFFCSPPVDHFDIGQRRLSVVAHAQHAAPRQTGAVIFQRGIAAKTLFQRTDAVSF